MPVAIDLFTAEQLRDVREALSALLDLGIADDDEHGVLLAMQLRVDGQLGAVTR